MATVAKAKVIISADDKASRKISGIGKSLGSLTKGLGAITGKIALLGGALTGAGIAGLTVATVKFGKAALFSASSLEQQQVAFETMLGSAEEAASFIGELQDFAKKTPFEITGITETAKKLMAMGFDAEEVLPTLQTLGDITALVGTEKLPFLTLALGQVQTAGRLMGTEVRQFTENGVPLLALLGEEFGKTTQEIREMVTAGEISFDDVSSALEKTTQEGGLFFEGMQKQSETLAGRWSNLKDTMNIFLQVVGGPILDFFKNIIDRIVPLAEEHLPNLSEVLSEKIGKVLEEKVLPALAGLGQKLLEVDWAEFIERVKNTFKEIGQFIGRLIELATMIKERGTPVLENFFERFSKIWNFLKDFFGPVVKDFIVPLLQDLWGTIINELIPALKEFWRVAGPVLTPILKFLGLIIAGILIVNITAMIATVKLMIIVIKNWLNIFTKLINKIKTVINWFKNLNQGVKDAMKDVFELITNPFGKAFETIVNGVKNAIEWLEKLNPFHRESPSLVDNIRAGTDEIIKSFNNLGNLQLSPVVSQVQAQGGLSGRFGAGTVGASNTININVNNPVVREENDIQELAKAIKRELAGDLELANRGIAINMF